MSGPRLLDLFGGQGGAGHGYFLAGFDVTGIDCKPQPKYPHRFIQADALEYLHDHGHEYDAIHASPPCQFGTTLGAIHRAKEGNDYDERHPNLIPQTRALLIASEKPYVIENVEGSRKAMIEPAMLCGTMFGLQTDCGAVLRRHRLFEMNWLFMCGLECQHGGRTVSITGHGAHDWAANYERRTIGIYGGRAFDRSVKDEMGGQQMPGRANRTISVHGDHPRDPSIERKRRVICVNGTGQPLSGARTITVTGATPQHALGSNRTERVDGTQRETRRETFPVSAARTAMGIDWMTMAGLSQALPPAYCKYIGEQLIQQLEAR